MLDVEKIHRLGGRQYLQHQAASSHVRGIGVVHRGRGVDQHRRLVFGIAERTRQTDQRILLLVIRNAVVIGVVTEVATFLACVVPSRFSVVQSKCHAIQCCPLQPNQTGGNLKTDPLPRRRQSSHISVCRTLNSREYVVRSPVRAMLPGPCGAPLQHDLRGQIRGIDVNVGNHDVAGVHRQRGGGVIEIMLVQTCRDDRLVRLLG